MTDSTEELAQLRRLLAEALSEAPDSGVSEGAVELRRRIVVSYERRRLEGQPEVDKQREDT